MREFVATSLILAAFLRIALILFDQCCTAGEAIDALFEEMADEETGEG